LEDVGSIAISAERRLLWCTTGDKPADFVGSNQWIGSMEVGYYLDTAFGIQWRNIFTQSGPEVADKVSRKVVVGSWHGIINDADDR